MANGSSVVGIGLQYGDEGKIKAFDRVAASAKVWVRFNGGPNAGHNLKVGDVHLITHGVPSGFYERRKNECGNCLYRRS